MTRKRPAAVTTEEFPDDMFERPLETLSPESTIKPLTEGSAHPVGYCNPPQEHRWKKGCRSPNPRGRPPKLLVGPFTQQMNERIDVDGYGQVSKREALDQVVISHAITKGGRWQDLLDERQARDRALKDRVEAFREYSRETPISATAEKIRREAEQRQFEYDFLNQRFPGLMEAVHKLSDLGAFAPEGGYERAAWLDDHKPTDIE